MSQSLREIADWLDPDWSIRRRVYGNGPPFDPKRYQAYKPDEAVFVQVTVDVDNPPGPFEAPDPPKTWVVSGSVDAGHLHDKVTYKGIPYLDTVDPPGPNAEELRGQFDYPGDRADRTAEPGTMTYLYNLFFSDYNACDLGMMNRTPDKGTRAQGYTDKGIIESHRWVDPADRTHRTRRHGAPPPTPDYRSLRSVLDRHRKGVKHRMLWQNVQLPDSRALNENLAAIACAFGGRFGRAGFDIVGMCEIPRSNLMRQLEEGYGLFYPDTQERMALSDLGVLIGQRRRGEDSVARKIVHADGNKFERSGPLGTSFGKEGWLRVVIEVPSLPGNPRFELFVTHLQGVFGEIPGTDVDEGFWDKKQQTKMAQLEELIDEIRERNDEKPQHPKIVMGDFNVHSRGRGGFDDRSGVLKGQYYSDLMLGMQEVGMQEVWLTFGGPGPNNKECPNKADGYLCDPFTPHSKNYYRGDRLDYVFIEKPRPEHELQIDISRVKMTGWPNGSSSNYLSDHVGIAFEILTSPAS